MNKIYLITYNTDATFNSQVFHNYITSFYPKYLSDWWHYINDFYLVSTSLNVNDLYNIVFRGIPGRHLIIIEVNPNNSQGWLPKQAWDWLQKYRSK